MSLGLLGAYDSSSSSSEDSDAEERKPQPPPSEADKEPVKLANPFGSAPKLPRSDLLLPKPSFLQETQDFKKSATDKDNKAAVSSSSVFSNPFLKREEAKKAVLEQHVSMTTRPEERTRAADGKKVCWNFRKGRCRFGHKCTFAHDSDIKVREADDRPQEAAKSTGNAARDMVAAAEAAGQHIYNQPRAEVVYDEDAVISAGKKRSSRPGLSDGLTPGKKAMKFHNKVYGSEK